MTDKKLRWGILSTANIARKNWKAIFHSGNGTVIAVASRDLPRARQFIADCQLQAPMENIPTAYGTYEALLADPHIDAVYIPLPTALRKEWVLRAAAAKKHIVCEKPCALSVTDLAEMLRSCRANGVQFMDGVMFMHSRRLQRLRTLLDDGALGDCKRITSAFSFRGSPDFFKSNIRVQHDQEPFGCLGDLGWYCIRFALWAMQWQLPTHVTGHLLSESTGSGQSRSVPLEFSGELFFPDGVSSSFYCSFVTHNEQWAKVAGTSGYLDVPDFVLPFFGCASRYRITQPVLNQAGCDFNLEEHGREEFVDEYSNSHPTAQETQLFRNFAERIATGKLSNLWPGYALKTQQVIEALVRSANHESRAVRLSDL